MKTRLISNPIRRQSQSPLRIKAFTLIELIVILCVIALLVATLTPTLAGSRVGSQAFQCQNNNRQLADAWRMYAGDNKERIVYSSALIAGPPPSSNPPDDFAWTGAHMDFNGANRLNWDPSYDLVKRPLWQYNTNAAIYKCPSDHTVISTVAGLKPRVLSFSMNLYMGGFAPQANVGQGPDGTDGGWGFANQYRIFSRTTDLAAPGPAKTFIFIDMRPEEINWGNFLIFMDGYPNNPALYQLGDLPGIFHNLGACFSFGDGHTEIHRWLDGRTAPGLTSTVSSFSCPNNVDVAWLQAHSTSPK